MNGIILDINWYDEKDVSVYGTVSYPKKYARTKEVKELRKKRRVDGIVQGYWYKVTREFYGEEIVTRQGRFRFTGTGKQIGYAIALCKDNGYVPEGFVDIDASKFTENPLKFSVKGVWRTFQVETHD